MYFQLLISFFLFPWARSQSEASEAGGARQPTASAASPVHLLAESEPAPGSPSSPAVSIAVDGGGGNDDDAIVCAAADAAPPSEV